MREEVRRANEEFIRSLREEHKDEIDALKGDDDCIEIEVYKCRDCGLLMDETDSYTEGGELYYWHDKPDIIGGETIHCCWECQSSDIYTSSVIFWGDGNYEA